MCLLPSGPMMKVEVVVVRHHRRLAALLVAILLAACAGDSASEPTGARQTTVGTAVPEPTAPSGTAPTTSDETMPASTTSTPSTDPPDDLALRPDGLGPVDFGTPIGEALDALSALLGPPDRDAVLGPDGECVEGAGWLDCLSDLRVIEQGRLVTWDEHGLQVAFVDSDGTEPQRPLPLQFADWLATVATGSHALSTPEGLHAGMSIASLRQVAPDLEFGYGEGVLAAFYVDVSEAGGYWGTVDWDPATAGNDFGEMVRAVQEALNAGGADIAVDGEWGPRSQAAWVDFLNRHGIVAVTSQLWLTPQIGDALGLPPDDSQVAVLGARPAPARDGGTPTALAPRADGFGTFDFGDPAEQLVRELEQAFGPPTDRVVFSAQPPDRLYLPGGYHALYDLAQYEWSDPGVLLILSDTPFFGDHWGDPVPGTLHLISWESTSSQLPFDSGLTVGSTLAQLRDAYPGVAVGSYDVCETDFDPTRFFADSSIHVLRGRLDWDWTSDLQAALDARGATLVVDGVYGPATRVAVEQFQQANDLDDLDGSVGPETVGALGLIAPSNAEVVWLQAGYPGSC